jgi:hypothetical protein
MMKKAAKAAFFMRAGLPAFRAYAQMDLSQTAPINQ